MKSWLRLDGCSWWVEQSWPPSIRRAATVIDFFVVSHALNHATEIACTIADGGFKPHSPARLYIEANARHAAAALPYGPPNSIVECNRVPTGAGLIEAPTETRRRGHDYVGLVRQIEAELCAVESLDAKEAAKQSGREKGVKYAWKNPLGDRPPESAKTTAVSRAWRNTACWLGTIAKTKQQAVASTARWRVLHYKHPKPQMATASREQARAMEAFLLWQKSLTSGMITHPSGG